MHSLKAERMRLTSWWESIQTSMGRVWVPMIVSRLAIPRASDARREGGSSFGVLVEVDHGVVMRGLHPAYGLGCRPAWSWR